MKGGGGTCIAPRPTMLWRVAFSAASPPSPSFLSVFLFRPDSTRASPPHSILTSDLSDDGQGTLAVARPPSRASRSSSAATARPPMKTRRGGGNDAPLMSRLLLCGGGGRSSGNPEAVATLSSRSAAVGVDERGEAVVQPTAASQSDGGYGATAPCCVRDVV